MRLLIAMSSYHNDISSISKTGLDLIHKAPIFYKYFRIDRKPTEPTKAMLFGQAAHMYLLEPDEFHFHFTVSPGPTKGNNINMDDFKHIENMSKIIHEIPEFKVLYGSGITEQTYHGVHMNTGVKLKCRTDLINIDKKMIVDPKFVEDASPNGFRNSMRKFRYPVQSAFYTDVLAQNGIEIKRFIFLAIEKKPPYAYGLYTVNQNDLHDARIMIENDIQTYAECIRTGIWSSYTKNVVEL